MIFLFKDAYIYQFIRLNKQIYNEYKSDLQIVCFSYALDPPPIKVPSENFFFRGGRNDYLKSNRVTRGVLFSIG